MELRSAVLHFIDNERRDSSIKTTKKTIKYKEEIKIKKILFMLLLVSIFMPVSTFAKEATQDNFEVVAEQERYYKTITNNNGLELLNTSDRSTTIEISKEEYDSVSEEIQPRGSGSSETTYKKLTTSILNNGSVYRYKTVLNWKIMPATRSYDSIGIGYYASVKYNANLNFSQTYCLTDGTCRTLTTYYPEYSTAGVGAAFKVPEGSFSSLSQTLFFDVAKNTSSTIISQRAYGDYSHATQTVSVSQARNFIVGTSGIQYQDGVASYYDDINPAIATWSGSW